MNPLLIEAGLILLLLIANGLFAMTEIAIVSSRRGMLKAMADRGGKGAARALELAENPNRFLSTVQIGITLVGLLAGAFGGTRFAKRLEPSIAAWTGGPAEEISFFLVICVLTFLSLVVGELVPKRLAMRHPEAIASTMARPMNWLSVAATPAVALLSRTTALALRFFGVRDEEASRMSREEFTVLMREGLVAGSTSKSETRMIEGVIGFEALDVYDIMIPRPRMEWIEEGENPRDVWRRIVSSTQEVFPVYKEHRDNLVGIVSVKDIYANLAAGAAVSFCNLILPPLLVPETQRARTLLETLRETGHRAAFVLDEFGGVVGMVTLMDLMESIVGDVPCRQEKLAMSVRKREDGSWLVDGLLEIEKLERHLEGFVLPEGGGSDFQTIAGWFTNHFSRVPIEGDRIVHSGWLFEIVDMDGPPVDKVLVTLEKAPPNEEKAHEGS
jgi:putative hemolysin